MKIVILDAHTTNPGDLSWDFLNNYADEVVVYERTAQCDVISRAKGAEILIINKTILGKEELNALSPKLKYIGLQSTGMWWSAVLPGLVLVLVVLLVDRLGEHLRMITDPYSAQQ